MYQYYEPRILIQPIIRDIVLAKQKLVPNLDIATLTQVLVGSAPNSPVIPLTSPAGSDGVNVYEGNLSGTRVSSQSFDHTNRSQLLEKYKINLRRITEMGKYIIMFI